MLNPVAIGLFGLLVIGSGLLRFLSAEGGQTGLIFGLVMGSIALLGSCFFLRHQNLPAQFASWTAITFVGGWFCYESFIKKGLGDAEPRQLVIIAVTFVTAFLLLWKSFSGRSRMQ